MFRAIKSRMHCLSCAQIPFAKLRGLAAFPCTLPSLINKECFPLYSSSPKAQAWPSENTHTALSCLKTHMPCLGRRMTLKTQDCATIIHAHFKRVWLGLGFYLQNAVGSHQLCLRGNQEHSETVLKNYTSALQPRCILALTVSMWPCWRDFFLSVKRTVLVKPFYDGTSENPNSRP